MLYNKSRPTLFLFFFVHNNEEEIRVEIPVNDQWPTLKEIVGQV
ncbi:hypothetical protein [Tepidibacillus sp. LV47]